MRAFWLDLRYAVRVLGKNPGFTTIAVLTLALGVAVNATMFSLVSAFLLQRPAVRDPERVVVISSVNPKDVFLRDAYPTSAPTYLAWREANHVFEDMTAAAEDKTTSLAIQGQIESVRSAAVAANYFSVLGVFPQFGRAFFGGEDRPGQNHVVILSHKLWQRRFGSNPAVLGRTIRLNRENYTVIGVMPANFRLLGFTPELWTPLVLTATDQTVAARKDRSLVLFGRLKPDVTLQQAGSEMDALERRAQQDFPETEMGWGVVARTLPDFLIHNFNISQGLALLMTTVGFVLLIACANVAGLLLARAAGRRKEISLRMALGASRLRLARQLLTEALVIALLGGATGLLLSYWGIAFVRASLTFNDAMSAVPLVIDWNVLLFVLSISLASAVLCALAPALTSSRTEMIANLQDEGRGTSAGRPHGRIRNILVTGEIALALFLLIGSGLLIRGIYLVEHQSLGFESDHLLTAKVTLDATRYKDAAQQAQFVETLLSKLGGLPGVRVAAIASELPATGATSVPFRIEGQPEPPVDQRPSVLDTLVTANYFGAVGVPLLKGRMFSQTDNEKSLRVVIVNDEFARRYLQNQEALGARIHLDVNGGSSDWSEIVGVVSNIRTHSEGTQYDPQVYEALLQRPVSSLSVMLRTSTDPGNLAGALRDDVAKVDAELPLTDVLSMQSIIDLQKGGNVFFVRIMSSFAVLALTLAGIGIYGLVAHSVGQRTREIGIRVAMGATTSDVLRMILWQGLKTAGIGAVVGLLIAGPLPKVFDAMFQDVDFGAPVLYVFVPMAVLCVAAVATYIPARRATRVDPMVALRYE